MGGSSSSLDLNSLNYEKIKNFNKRIVIHKSKYGDSNEEKESERVRESEKDGVRERERQRERERGRETETAG